MIGALLGAVIYSEAVAEVVKAKSDGWHTWQVDQPDVSTQMCCFTWKNGGQAQNGCSLDGRGVAFTSSGDCAAAPGTVQVYVKYKGGSPEDIRVLSSNCPASSKSEITDHGLISAAENLGWFRDIIEDKRQTKDAREEALFGLVMSGGDAAFAYIDRLLAS